MWPGKTEQRSFEVDLLCSHIHEHICGEVCHLKPARQKKAKNSKPKRRKSEANSNDRNPNAQDQETPVQSDSGFGLFGILKTVD